MDTPLTPTPQPNAKLRISFLISLVAIAAATRLLPHPPNFSPIGAMALFGAATVRSRFAAFLIPFAAMLLSDMVIGFHVLMPVVYACFAFYVVLGFWLQSRRTVLPIAGAALLGATVFYIVSNYANWYVFSQPPYDALPGSFPHTFTGLIASYVSAIPYFGYWILGDAVYCTLLFGGLALAESKWPALRTQPQMQPTSA